MPDASGFAAKLKADLARLPDDFKVDIQTDLKKAFAEVERFRLAQSKDAIRIPVELDEKQLRDGIVRAKKEFDRSSGGGMFALKLNLAEAGISLIPGAVTGLVDLASALQQVAQAGLVVPGALAGVGASIGTMALGLSGVSDAYKEISKAATTAGIDQAAQARAAAQAQQQLRNAAVDDANAHKDLARAYQDARQELQDLNIEARGGQISEAQAVNDALKARRDLAKGGFKDQLEYNDALLRVASADQRVVETHQRNIEFQDRLNEANAKGIDNSDKVIDAQERVVRSGQQVADAQSAVEQATTKTSAAATAAAQAMAALSPNARELVDTLVALKPTFEDFRNSISQTLLDGVSGEIRTLVDTDLPILQNGMGKIAGALNQNFKTLIGSLTSGNSQSLLDRILGNTAEAQKRSDAIIDPLVRGLGALTAAGSDALPRLADDMARLADHFADFIEAADKDGRLDKWINDGITGFEHLGSILGNIGSSFLSITRAAGNGQGLLGTMDNLTEELANFLGSTEGQAQMREFFQQAREDLRGWLPILQSLPGIFKGVLDASQSWMNTWLPLLRTTAKLLGDHPALVEAVVVAFTAWKTISGVASLISNLEKISTLLRFTLPADAAVGAAGMSRALAGPLGAIAALVAGTIYTANQLPDMLDGVPYDLRDAGRRPGEDEKAYEERLKQMGAIPNIDQQTQDTLDANARQQQQATDLGGLLGAPAVPSDRVNPTPDPTNNPGDLFAPGGPLAGNKVFGPRDQPADLGGLLGSYENGGPTPSGPGPGPTGGWPVEVHPNEWVIPADARAAVGDSALSALTNGAVPAMPASPATSSGAPGTFDPWASIVAGATRPTVQGQDTTSSGPKVWPGLWGLAQAAGSDNPDASFQQWGSQTMDWLGGFARNAVTGFGSELLTGALRIFGLQESILSPSNQWFRDGASVANFIMGSDGPIASMMGGNTALPAPATIAPGFGSQSIPLGDGNTTSIPTFGTTAGGGSDPLTFLRQYYSSMGITLPEATGAGSATPSGKGTLIPGNWGGMDALASRFGLSMISGYRSPNGPPAGAAGVPANRSYHGSGRAHDYAGSPQQMASFATLLSSRYGGQIKELIYGGPGWSAATNILNGSPHNYDKTTLYDHGLNNPGGAHVHVAFSGGGAAFGPGGPHGDAIPAWLSSGEHVLTAEDVQMMGGQDGVYAFRNALHRAYGGDIPQGMVLPPRPKPDFDPGAGARKMNVLPPGPAKVAPAAVPGRGAAPLPPPEPAKILDAPVAVPGEQAPPDVNSGDPTQKPGWSPLAGQGAAPASMDHTNPALSKGIQGVAGVIGNMVSMAASAAAAGGTMGLSAAGGGSAAGSIASGLITQGGKLAAGLANVGSSFLVGTLTGGSSANAYGETLRPAQNVPVTAPNRTQINTFNGMDVPRVFQELDLRNAQDQQAHLAHRPVR